MIEHGINGIDSTVKEMADFFKTRVENLEPRINEKLSSTASKKKKEKKTNKNRKQDDYDSSVIDSSKESCVDHRPVRKYYILNGK